MKTRRTLSILLYSIPVSFIANSFLLLWQHWWLLAVYIPVLLTIAVLAGFGSLPTKSLRLRLCHHGVIVLSVFEASGLIGILFHSLLAFHLLPHDFLPFLGSILQCVLVEGLLFWVGILCLYATSVQLGIRQRIVGILCGMIPVLNLIVLHTMITTAGDEVVFACQREFYVQLVSDLKNKGL